MELDLQHDFTMTSNYLIVSIKLFCLDNGNKCYVILCYCSSGLIVALVQIIIIITWPQLAKNFCFRFKSAKPSKDSWPRQGLNCF